MMVNGCCVCSSGQTQSNQFLASRRTVNSFLTEVKKGRGQQLTHSSKHLSDTVKWLWCTLIHTLVVFCFFFYIRKYIAIVSHEQRQSYKDDFDAEYDEYRSLYARMENITRRFMKLDAQRKQLSPGSKEYQVKQNKTTHVCLFSHLFQKSTFSAQADASA